MKKRAFSSLPDGYSEVYGIDLQKNKKQALIVNVGALIIMLVMVVIALIFKPIEIDIFDTDSLLSFLLNLGIAFLGIIVYIILHELTHGVFMRAFSGEKVKYGFTGMYAYAGSDAYYPVLPYIIIALAPVVIWGIVLLLLNVFLPASVFWGVYCIQVQNISGAAGDLYVTVRFLREKRDILIQDSGVSMKVYSKI